MEGEEEVKEAAGVVRKRRRVGEAAADAEEEGGGAAYEKADLLVLGDDGPYEGIAEEAVAEVMRWLEAEIAPPAPADAFVTINESCGPSFSAAASTVMATVDTRAGAPPVPWPWPEPEPAEPQPVPAPALPAPPGADADADMDGADEEWLARLLTCGALLEGVL